MKHKTKFLFATTSLLFSSLSLAQVSVFESKDILTKEQALGRYQWLQQCYSDVLISIAEQILDPTIPRTGEQKQAALKEVLLYKNGQLKDDAKYVTFGDDTGKNPKRWYAGKSASDTCTQIPSDYSISALMLVSSLPAYCPAQSREKGYEYIKSVKFSKMENNSDAAFYSNFVGQTARIYKDRSYELTLTPGFTDSESYPESWHVFVDWNRDGDFLDTSESQFAGVSQQSVSLQLTPPSGTQPGLTKMRISMDYLGGSLNACSEIDSGEIEDYLLYIK
ncbi:collagenase [Pseudoalteromonas sp. NBT06-2]|uniref:GEVED domain-containing protein n=1 Tax=Pseudoalteromonas sp. NBT06-2 TaxID=2025950 RepID=UPI000BA7E29F|nr:GEVED domain-containing protein [Pseudoalteromonas sp. NBT06-2]PAJ76229.1 collagenase [Pseudoalteromonas sp. NBT06-2]